MRQDLPISSYEDEILRAVKYNRVVIIKAETGAGKSTQVPQFLLKLKGVPRVVVTQPRRIAATSIAQRVAEEMKCEIGGIVGYRTSLDRKDSDKTQLLFCTDGLELVRELFGDSPREGILVIDEVHEWNLNIEILVAWARHQLKKGAEYRVVIMSATIDASALVEFFGGDAALVEVPGRMYPVTERNRSKDIAVSTGELLKEGHNVLVFQPGKAEIQRTISTLRRMDVDAEVFPLHSEMSLMDQMPCFLQYPRPKCIVATNVAQTSITIPDIDAVVDSGLERHAEYVDGVEGLYIRPISLADRKQRKGRAGRTKPGIYVDFCPTATPDRQMFSKAEVLCLPLEKVILQLAKAGMRIEDLKFYHQPIEKHIQEAKDTLLAMGCVDRSGVLTLIGARVASLPVSARFGRMLVEAEKRKVLSQMIILVSIMEQGGITRDKGSGNEKVSVWSDAFVQMAAFVKASRLPFDYLEQHGIDASAFAEAQQTSRRLQTVLKHGVAIKPSVNTEKEVVCSLYAGLVDRVYKKSLVKGYKDSAGNLRNLPDGSVVANAERVVGLPWNLQVRSELGPKTLRLITMATRVDDKLFAQVAPGRV
jgi:ATP-dependent helicase HrpA